MVRLCTEEGYKALTGSKAGCSWDWQGLQDLAELGGAPDLGAMPLGAKCMPSAHMTTVPVGVAQQTMLQQEGLQLGR